MKKNITFRRIGFDEGDPDYPLFSVTLNDAYRPKITVCFSAGMHGNEISGPLAACRFISAFDYRQYVGIKVVIFPLANPYGFRHRTRQNTAGKNLNRHFCDRRLTGANKILYEALDDESIFFFHALHDDIDEKRFYLYNFEKQEEKIYRDIIKLAGKTFPINEDRSIYGDRANGGLIVNRSDGSFEERMFRDGTFYSMCTEMPGKQSLEKRIELNVKIMNLAVKFSDLKIKNA